MTTETPICIWVHQDGRTITVYPTHKVRAGFRPADPWPILERAQVPTITDEQWQAQPLSEGGWSCAARACRNCGQWVWSYSGNCMNECQRRGMEP